MAEVLRATGAVAGYWLGIRIGDYRVRSSPHAGVVAFWGPLALFFSAYLARIPSSVLSGYYPATGQIRSTVGPNWNLSSCFYTVDHPWTK
jgi:hypothetical protein